MKIEVIKAIQAIGDKMTAEEIQRAFGIGIDTESKYEDAPSNAHLTDAERWKKYEEDMLVKLRNQGKTANEIAEKLNRSESSVRSKTTQMIGNGIIKQKENMGKAKKAPRKYTKRELDELNQMLEIYGEPNEVMKNKEWLESFCRINDRTQGAVRTRLHLLWDEKSGLEQMVIKYR